MVRVTGAPLAAALAALGALAGGCTLITDSFLTNDFSGDPFPTAIDTRSGALLVGVQPLDQTTGQTPGQPPQQRAVLDLLSPVTLIDPGKVGDPSLRSVDLLLLGKNTDGTLTLPRARFPQAQLISLHPCPIPYGADPMNLPACTVGTPAAPPDRKSVV